jgi:hypothetical protein
MINISKIITVTVSILAISGCSISRKDINNGPPFVQHRNVIERSFAQTGYVIGCIVGLPVSIVAAPVTIPIASNSKDAQGGLVVLAPVFGIGYGIGTLFGAITWPFCGWYELGPIEENNSAQQGDAPEPASPAR